jgi:transcription-repair coupling factor (superfamily II helicase)
MGIDMYMKLLKEAINKEKGIEEEQKVNYHIDVPKHIEREYVSDDVIIIYIHKEINSISTLEDKENTIIELENRFGKLSKNVLDYIEERYLESLLRYFHIDKVNEAPNLITIHIPKNESSNLKGEDVLKAAYELSDDITIEYRNNQYIIKYSKSTSDREWLYVLSEFFASLKK